MADEAMEIIVPVILLALFLAALACTQLPRALRLRAARNRPFPAAWERLLSARLPCYDRLPAALRERLHGLIPALLKTPFEGCGGLVLSEEMRVIIAAHACLMATGGSSRRACPGLDVVLVYPGAFVGKWPHVLAEGVEIELEEERDGESWRRGTVILAWDAVRDAAAEARAGRNVVFHEFAHQFDERDRVSQSREMLAAYDELCRTVDDEVADPVLDDYATESPQEFFAVASEMFFTQPLWLRDGLADVYTALKGYYGLDPVAWPDSREDAVVIP